MPEDYVILVDHNDAQTGTMEKNEAHRQGLLHRAISVFIFNSEGQWLIQQRADHKYHSNSLWSNTCCTHPFPSENNEAAAKRRLMDEMGIQCNLSKLFHFVYKEPLDNQLTEFEFDHVFVGVSDDTPTINPHEVMDYKYIDFIDLKDDIAKNQSKYTLWFKLIVEKVHSQIAQLNMFQQTI